MSASLRKFIITRILLTIPMVLILITLVFIIMRILPGDPIRSQLVRASPKRRPTCCANAWASTAR